MFALIVIDWVFIGGLYGLMKALNKPWDKRRVPKLAGTQLAFTLLFCNFRTKTVAYVCGVCHVSSHCSNNLISIKVSCVLIN